MSTAAASLRPLSGAIEPRRWPGTAVLPPESCTIDGRNHALDESDLTPDSALSRRMNRIFDEVGLVWLRNAGLEDLPTMRRFAKLVVRNEMKYQGGANPSDNIEANVYDRFDIPVDWATGDVVIVCNYRFALGRPGVHLEGDEQRGLGVVIGESFRRVGDLDNKW